MNCEEIQTRLSEYLDRSLDTISAKGIEVHLSSCPLCRSEAAALSDCVRQVAALPAVEPPIGFTQRVMAHVREIETKPTVWQRMFFPLKVKLPIHATAVVLVAGLAFLVSPRQDPSRDRQASGTGTRPASSTSPGERGKAELASLPQQDFQEPASKKPTQLARQFVDQAKGNKTSASPAVPPVAAKSELQARAEVEQQAPRRPPIQAQEVSTARESLRPSFDQFVIGIPGGQSRPSLRATPFAAESSPLAELSPDVEFVVRRRGTHPLQPPRPGSADTVQDLAAKRSASAAIPPQASAIAEIRWFSVQSDLYDRFKKELETEALIETEKPITLPEGDFSQKPSRDLLIKVIILSPVER